MYKYLLSIILITITINAYLPANISTMMKKLKIKSTNVSIKISETKTGRVLASYREYKSRYPASVMKVLTTYSALLELGKNFKWPTRLFYRGTFNKGVIDGDLIIKGYGDPTLSCNDPLKIAKRLKRLGIDKITGNIIIDRSFFAVGDKIYSGFDNHKYSEYNAMPDALMFDDHLCRIIIKPDKYRVSVERPLPDYSFEIVNNIKSTNRRCRGNYSWPRVSVSYDSEKPKVILSGYLSNRCSPKRIRWVIGHPYSSFYYVFIDALKKVGIEYNGVMKLGKLQAGDAALITHYSKPLIKIVAKTNKKSNNLYARHIFLMVGAKFYGAPATLKKARRAIKAILGSRGLLDNNTILDNGCGLSRKARLDAHTLHKVLQSAYRDFGKEWMNTLAIAGVDGTIKKRFRYSIARGRAWMKTGTLKNAKNIAGYVLGRSGKLYTVVIFYNGAYRWRGSALQNRVIEWLVKKH